MNALPLPLLVVLALSLVAAAALVRGVALGYPRPSLPTDTLSAKEQAVLSAAADAIFPPGGALPVSATQAGVVSYLIALLAGLPPRPRLLIHLLLQFVEHGPWAFNLRRRLSRQSPEERVQTFESWEQSRFYFLRVTFQSLRTLVGMAYLANLQVAGQIGAVTNPAPFAPRGAA